MVSILRIDDIAAMRDERIEAHGPYMAMDN